MSSAMAQRPLLHCIAQEEDRYHVFGYKYLATYRLNKRMMGKLINIPELKFQRVTVNAVCSKNTKYPAVKLLEHLIQYQEKTFVLPDSNEVVQMNITKSLISSLIDELPDILHDYISHLQEAAPNAGCLEKRVPGLTDYYVNMKYLQMELSPSQILNQNNMPLKIMRRLNDIDYIIYECIKEDIEKKEKEKEKERRRREQFGDEDDSGEIKIRSKKRRPSP
jgi:hypothetical protein